MSIRVLVVDDQEMFRLGLASILAAQPDIVVAGEAADGREAVARVRSLQPDVVLMDVRMPELNGIEATKAILADEVSGHRPRIVMLTTFDVDDYIFAALRAGASGFLLKDASPAELVAAVHAVHAGDSLLSPGVTRSLIAEYVTAAPLRRAPDPRLNALTDREREVLVHVAQGLSNAEIAGRLFISEQTTKSHVSRIFTKLELRDRAQAVVYAYESGLVTAGEGRRGGS
ncbi:DNA-binding response regulator [Agrococcus baldri]|uniref:DNA-binding response regulator n=1 Tax=Agrococcus baldri TaxID=153730 RepID=A0AA87RB65_9MICO|nr:DNA-binding response regulator [Agrococcus baldri]